MKDCSKKKGRIWSILCVCGIGVVDLPPTEHATTSTMRNIDDKSMIWRLALARGRARKVSRILIIVLASTRPVQKVGFGLILHERRQHQQTSRPWARALPPRQPHARPDSASECGPRAATILSCHSWANK